VREKVVDDLKKLATLDTTRTSANEFLDQTQADGWQETIDKYNRLYGDAEPNDANAAEPPTGPFRLTTRQDLTRITDIAIETVRIRNEGDATADVFLQRRLIERRLVDKLFELVPPDANGIERPTVLEFAPGMGFYCVRELSVERPTVADYTNVKTQQAFAADYARSQALAAVHYNPENIVARNNFQPVEREDQAPEGPVDESEAAGP
jgi:hypothetical protein